MAEIVGGLGCSHAPTIARTWDAGEADSPEWRPLFASFAHARAWMTASAPDALVVIYNDHMDNFFLDAMPTFTIGVGERFEGGAARGLPAIPGHPDLALWLARDLVEQGFDFTVCHDQDVDHGVLAPLPLVNRDWTYPVVPININVVAEPIPTPRRCWALGVALSRAIKNYNQRLRIVVVGTGGLSHQLDGPRFGEIRPEWDREFLRLLGEDPESLSRLSASDFADRGGDHSVEVMQWIAMRGAMPIESEVDFAYYYPRQTTGFAVAGYRPRAYGAT